MKLGQLWMPRTLAARLTRATQQCMVWCFHHRRTTVMTWCWTVALTDRPKNFCAPVFAGSSMSLLAYRKKKLALI